MKRSTGSTLLLLAALSVSLLACSRRDAAREPAPPFVFRSLNLRQQDQRGGLTWELTSPEARYDISRRLARAIDPRGTIYADGEPLYEIKAASGTVLNDGELIQLEGNATVRRMGRQPVTIKASRIRWMPAKDLMEFDHRPEAVEGRNRITARRARFRISEERLDLTGSPQLQHWPDGFRRDRPPEVNVSVSRATWQVGSGKLEAAGPVRGVRTVRTDGKESTQTLTGSSLTGNTVEQRLSLLAPVAFSDPGRKASFQGSGVDLDLNRRILRSEAPFQGRVDALTVQGSQLWLDQNGTTAVIGSGCRLTQPGDQLEADSCRWNWQTRAVEASGAVVLTREANQQITRASRMTGQLGPDGQVTFSSPGGRVQTRVRVPKGSGARRSPSGRR